MSPSISLTPVFLPSMKPTNIPSSKPSRAPTFLPTVKPSRSGITSSMAFLLSFLFLYFFNYRITSFSVILRMRKLCSFSLPFFLPFFLSNSFLAFFTLSSVVSNPLIIHFTSSLPFHKYTLLCSLSSILPT